VNKRW